MLFESDEQRRKRERRKRQREREKRNKEYEKRKAKEKPKEKAGSNNGAIDALGKVLNFFNGVFDLFVPSKSRTRHDRLTKSGAIFALCLVSMFSGLFMLNHNYRIAEFRKTMTSSFLTDDLKFSRSGTEVKGGKPFMTQDRKTIYIPLSISMMNNLDPDASQYHIFIIPRQAGVRLKYRILQAQLVSYGSTGRMFIEVKAADPIVSQPIQFVIWSGSKLTGDNYDPDDDTEDGTELAAIKKKYDTLAFSINLGGKSIKRIAKTRPKEIKTHKLVKNPKTHKKELKTITKIIQVPIVANEDLYNDHKLQYVYNRMYAGPKLARLQKKAQRKFDKMQLAANKIHKDYQALKRSNFNVPKLPTWATNPDNNAANGLDITLKQMQNFNLLNPDETFDLKLQNKLDKELVLYEKVQKNTYDDDDDETVETKYASKLADKDLRNRTTGESLSNSDDDNNSNKNADSEWSELKEEVMYLANAKNSLYYVYPLLMWQQYKDFLTMTSSGSSMAAKQNVGAITYSKTSGHNKHGKYMTIAMQPEAKDGK